MLQGFPRAAAALVAAGVLVTGAAIAASAHQLSFTGSSEDDTATAPRVESPEPSESPEATAPPIVFVSPEPTETPEASDDTNESSSNPEEDNEAPAAQTHEQEDNRAPSTTTAPTPESREGDRSGDDGESSGGHD